MVDIMDSKTGNPKSVRKNELQSIKSNVSEVRRLIHGTGEPKDIVKRLDKVFSSADTMKVPPAELTDLLDEIFDMYPQPEPQRNEEYREFFSLLLDKKALDHKWIGNYYKSFAPNALIDVTLSLLQDGEYELAMGLMNKFGENVYKADNMADMLHVKQLHIDFVSTLEDKVPDVSDISKSLSDRSITGNIIKVFNDSYQKGSKLWPVNLGKKRVLTSIERYRPEYPKYVNALKNKYPDVYRILYSQEAFFYFTMPPQWREKEALPRITCDFISVETFFKKTLKLPPGFAKTKNKPVLGDYVRYLEKNPKKLSDSWRKFYWNNPYIHRNAIGEFGKRYSLSEGLNQYKDWREGRIATALSNWDFAQHVIHPFTYEVLCDLMDGFEVV